MRAVVPIRLIAFLAIGLTAANARCFLSCELREIHNCDQSTAAREPKTDTDCSDMPDRAGNSGSNPKHDQHQSCSHSLLAAQDQVSSWVLIPQFNTVAEEQLADPVHDCLRFSAIVLATEHSPPIHSPSLSAVLRI